MNRTLSTLVLLITLLYSTALLAPTYAQSFSVGLHGGVVQDPDALLGANARFGLKLNEDLTIIINPNLDFILFENHRNRTWLTLAALYPFFLSQFQAYLGGGLRFQFTKYDNDYFNCDIFDCSDTDVGVVGKAGGVFSVRDLPVDIFGEIGLGVGADTGLFGRVGILYVLGGNKDEE